MTGSLASVHPELIPEWSEKNLPLTPDKITFGSNKRVWWKGACGHEWETSVKARSKGEKCPICSGARVIEGINDLATLKPLLAQEWSKKNKLKPTEVSVASHMVSNGLLAFIVVITLFEIGVTIYKTLRYGVSVKNGINSNT